MQKTDYLIIGSGIAGLTAATLLSELGSVMVVTKGKLQEGNTYWAQGGIAAVMDKDDHFESHIEDTLKAGAGHCDEHAVRFLIESAPKAIRFLQSIGVKFQEKPVLEAGHSFPRVWRTSDFTGQDVLNVLIKKVKKNKAITLLENTEAVDLIVYEGGCRGIYVRDADATVLSPVLSKYVILATGGLGQLYLHNTNTPGSAGEGLAMAVRAGLALRDMEFIQFHPTAFALEENGRHFLLSEALRGFGAKIVNAKGERFTEKVDPRAELMPRDLLTRAIYFEQLSGPVYLTLQYLDKKEVHRTFPNITKRLKEHRLDLATDKIPITPAAHYAMGGVPTDLKGATKLPNLFAVGEVASTGVHGANRLASNSLLEAVVFAQSVFHTLEKSKPLDEAIHEILPASPKEVIVEDLPQVKVYSQRIKQIMWEKAGIIRTPQGLKEAKTQIEAIPARDFRIQNRQIVCYKIIEAALARPQSLGAHFMTSELT